jgi:hypothetical protein
VESRRATRAGAKAIDLGQAEAGALADFLGREEGLEHPLEKLRRNAGAAVLHADHDEVAAETARGARGRIGSFDAQRSTAGHGVARIDGEVEQCQLELGDVEFHRPRVRLDMHLHAHGGAHGRPHQRPNVGQLVLQPHALEAQRLPVSERQQLSGQLGATRHGAFDGGQMRTVRHRGLQPSVQVNIVGNHHQQVVEIVGHAAAEPAQRFELLGLSQAVLDLLAVRRLVVEPLLHLQ